MAQTANYIFPPMKVETGKAPINILGLCVFLSCVAHAGAFAFIPDLNVKTIEAPVKNLTINLVSLAAPKFEPQKIEPASGNIKTQDIQVVSTPEAKEIIAKPQPIQRPVERIKSSSTHKSVEKEKTISPQKTRPHQSVNDQGEEKTSVIPLIKKPNILKQTPPTYPPRAQRMGQQGTVLLHALVGQNGQAIDLKIVSSSGYKSLDASAVSAVKTWKFASANQGGKPIKAWVEVPVKFILR